MTSDDDKDSDGLRLNTLARYRKQSTQLTLEVHSHCEVPAGCGGAVIRWRRPGANVGINVWSYLAEPHGALVLDGVGSEEMRASVASGEHVLAFTTKATQHGFVMLRLTLQPEIATALTPSILSKADGHFRATTTPPPTTWANVGFDDSAWAPLVERDVPDPGSKRHWMWQSLREDGAIGLGLPSSLVSSSGADAWVRCVFHVDDAGFR